MSERFVEVSWKAARRGYSVMHIIDTKYDEKLTVCGKPVPDHAMVRGDNSGICKRCYKYAKGIKQPDYEK